MVVLIQQVNGTIDKPRYKGGRPVFYTQIALSSTDSREGFLDYLINFAFDTLQANLDLRVIDTAIEERQGMELN